MTRTICFFNDTATTEIYTLSLHDALPIFLGHYHRPRDAERFTYPGNPDFLTFGDHPDRAEIVATVGPDGTVLRERSEEHTSELQSRQYLVCRLLLVKKNWLQSPLRVAVLC